MSRPTPALRLPYFEKGDRYSASTDQARMRMVDEQLRAFSEVVGDGVVDGLDFSVDGGSLFISPGSAFINGHYCRLLVGTRTELPRAEDGVFLRRTENAFAKFGKFSSSRKVTINESLPILPPAIVASRVDDQVFVNLDWTNASIATRLVHLMIDGVFVAELDRERNSYSTSIREGQSVSISVIPFTFTGGMGAESSRVLVSRPFEDVQPPAPTGVAVIENYESISLLVDKSFFGLISHRIVEWRELDNFGNPVGDSISTILGSGQTSLTIKGLSNRTRYKLSITNVSIFGRESFPIVKYFVPTGAVPQGDVDDVLFESLRDESGKFFLRVTGVTDDGYATLSTLQVRVHKNGNFGFEYSSEDMQVPSTGIIDIFSLRVREGNSFTSKPIEDNSSYTAVLFRRINGVPTRGRFSKTYTGDSTPPNSVSSLGGSASDRGEVRWAWSHENPTDVYAYRINISERRIIERRDVLTEPPFDAIYIARRLSAGNFNFSFSIRGRTLTISAVDTEDYGIVEGFTSSSFDISGKTMSDVVDFINSASVRLRNRVTGIVYAIYQLIESRIAFSYTNISGVALDFVKLSSSTANAASLISVVSSQMLEISPISSRMGFASPDFDDQTGGFFSAGGVILQCRSPSDDLSPAGFFYEFDSSRTIISSLTKLSGFILPSVLVKPGYQYVADVLAIDEAGNASPSITSAIFSPFIDDISTPETVNQVSASGGFEGMVVTWNPNSVLSAKRFIIYRATLNTDGSLGMFGELANIDTDSPIYTDLMVTDGFSYIYRVGYENFWGKRSAPPGSTEIEPQVGVLSTFTSRAQLPGPTQLNIEMVNDDLVCSWSPYVQAAEGFEIWISDPISGRFKLVSTLPREETSFILRNAKIANGDYRFAIRAVSSESSIVTARIDNPPANSILLYRSSISGDVDDQRRNLNNLTDPILDILEEEIGTHRHFRISDDVDLRIDLSDTYRISEFLTNDRKTFFPSRPIEGGIDASVGTVLVNGGAVSSAVSVTADGIVTFTDAQSPNIKLELVIFGTAEVEGQLESSRVVSISSTQITSGRVSVGALPDLEHDARYRQLMPATCLVEPLDGFKWLVVANERKRMRFYNPSGTGGYFEAPLSLSTSPNVPLGYVPYGFPICRNGGRSFVYDFAVSGNSFLMCSSVSSIYSPSLDGFSEIQSLRYSSPPDDMGAMHRVRVFSDNRYAVVAFRGIDIFTKNSRDDIVPLVTSFGLADGVRCFRDVLAASDGTYIAVASNGLWRIEIKPRGVVNRQQFGLSSVGNAIIWAAFKIGSVLYVYTEFGLYRGSDTSSEFNLTNLLPGGLKIVDHVSLDDGTSILVDTHSVWRIKSSGAVKVYDTEDRLGRCTIHQGKFYVCSESGLLSTASDTDIGTSGRFVLRKMEMPKFLDQRFFLPLTVSSGGEHLYVSGEGGVIRTRNLSTWEIYIDTYGSPLDGLSAITYGPSKESPTLFVDGSPRHIDCYYQFDTDGANFTPLSADNENNNLSESGRAECIFFHDPPDDDRRVELARTYFYWKHPGGSWAHIDYAAPVALKINGRRINDGSRAQRPYDDVAIIAAISPTFGEEASAYASVLIALSDLKNHADFMLVNTSNQNTGEPTSYGVHKFSRINMRLLLKKIDIVNRFIYDSDSLARLGIDGNFRIPKPVIAVNLLANVFNPGFGVRKEGLTSAGIDFRDFTGDNVRNTLGVWDEEDLGYRLPPLKTREINSGAITPNYTPYPIDSDSTTIPIEQIGFTGEFTYFGSIPGTMRFFGRRIPDGPVLRGPDDVLSEGLGLSE